MDPASAPAMDDDMISWSSNGGPPTPGSSTMSPSSPPPPPPPPSLHMRGCPIDVGARIHCTHESGSCKDCQLREHGSAAVAGMLERVCICAQHNPAPPLLTPVGQQRVNALVGVGARDLLMLESAREHVAWLSAHMGDAIGRVIQARMAGSRPRADDLWVINEATSLMTRMLPRMEGPEGAFSLDSLPVPVRHLVLPSSPLWDGWAVDADAASAAARRSVEEPLARTVRQLDERKEALRPRGRPLTMGGFTPYQGQTTTQGPTLPPIRNVPILHTPEQQQKMMNYQHHHQHPVPRQPLVVNGSTPYRSQTTTETQTSAPTQFMPGQHTQDYQRPALAQALALLSRHQSTKNPFYSPAFKASISVSEDRVPATASAEPLVDGISGEA